jgi:ribokinase
MSRIIVAGSINMDVVAQVKDHPQPGQTIFGSDLRFIPGGKGSNQAIAASRLRNGVQLIGKLGQDAFGDSLLAFLQGERLDLSHLTQTPDAPTGTALIAVSEDSENTIIVISGSNSAVGPDDVDDVSITQGDIVASVFEIPQETILVLFKRAQAAGAKTVLNPAPAVSFIPGLLEVTDYVIVNETELAFFAGGMGITETATGIQKYAAGIRAGPEQVIIVTLGRKGAVGVRGDEVVVIPGHEVKAVDTTGAGDCFTGALAVALCEGVELERALHFANAAASLSVQKMGAATSMPDRELVDAITRQLK